MKKSYLEMAAKIQEKCKKAPSCKDCMFYVKLRGCRFKDGFPEMWNLEVDDAESSDR